MKEPATRGRPRRAETDDALMRATVELLREKGPAGVTVEAVAALSGVARTTIYRRFANRGELIAAAIAPVVERALPGVDLSLSAKVRWVLDQAVELFDLRLGAGVVAAIISDADPEFTGALRSALERQVSALVAQIQSDIDAGEVAEHVDPDALVGLLLGGYLSEVLRHGTPRTGWVDSTVDLVTKAIEPSTPVR
jgi:AcrR family transcriptional regulator